MKAFVLASLWLLAACQAAPGPDSGNASGMQGDGIGDNGNAARFAGIAAETMLRFSGTEPFWGGSVTGTSLIWTTPEDIDGETIAVARFAGNGGLGFSGTLAGASFDMTVTPGECSDGMSDRIYPFTVTVQLGAEQLNGCAWRDGDDLGDAAP